MKSAATVLGSVFVITSLLSVFEATSANAFDKKPDADYWRDTGLSFDNTGDYLNKRCYQSAKNLVACFQALSYAASRMQLGDDPEKPVGGAILTPAQAAKEADRIDKLVASFGPVNLYQEKRPANKETYAQFWKRYQGWQTDLIASANLLFNDPKAQKIDAKAILKSVGPKALVGEFNNGEALLCSYVVDSYLMSAVDPHTHINSVALDAAQAAGEVEEFVGVGATMGDIAGKITFTSIMEGGPALAAGLHRNDVLINVDGTDLQGKKGTDAVKVLRGVENTVAKVTVLRDGKPMTFDIPRKHIKIENFTAKMISDDGVKIGYLRLKNFSEQYGCDAMKTQVQTLTAQGAKGFILDLRSNPGGIVQEAVCMGGIFVGNQKIVEMRRFSDQATREVNENAESQAYYPLDPDHTRFSRLPFMTTDLPLVTLINGDAASASEILSGALQDYKRGWIAGERSYGKASVQVNDQAFSITDQLLLFEEPKIKIYRTEARFYQPLGRTNQIVGIVPDFEIDPVPHATDDQKFTLREADLYTNALPAIGTPWVNPRTAEIAPIAQCAKATGTAEAMYSAHKDDVIPGDFQIYSAEDILKCSLSK